MLDQLVICYLNNVLFFALTWRHQGYAQQVVKRLWTVDLYPKANKSECHTDKVEFLGFAVVPNGTTMDKRKVQTILDWLTPCNLHQCRSDFNSVSRNCPKVQAAKPDLLT
jgi:hypothetical protein